MSKQTYYVLTAIEQVTSKAFNTVEIAIEPRLIDADFTGDGININAACTAFPLGESVPLLSRFVVPERVATDPAYMVAVPGLLAFLARLPGVVLESTVIFEATDV